MKSISELARLSAACALVAVCAAASAGDINKCVDKEGHILITDSACDSDSNNVGLNVSDSGSVGIAINTVGAGKPTALAMERVDAAAQVQTQTLTPEAAPRSQWASLPRPLQRRTVSLDAGTLQEARANMLMQDELRHQRRVASVH